MADTDHDDEPEQDVDVEMIRRHARALMEHFDTVQIFTTRHRPNDGTVNVDVGYGNWFARFGHVGMWLKIEAEKETVMRVKRHIDNLDNDDT